MSQTIIEKITEISAPILDSLSLELVDMEYRREERGWILRVYIDKEGGINLDACAEFSRELGAILEVEDPIKVAYYLEVSSPGIHRPLKKLADFDRFAGSLVKIRTHEEIDPDGVGRLRKMFSGELLGVKQGNVLVRLDEKSAPEVGIEFDLIAKANLDFKF